MHLMFKLTCFNIMPVRFIKSKTYLHLLPQRQINTSYYPSLRSVLYVTGPVFPLGFMAQAQSAQVTNPRGKKMRFYNLPYTAQENKIIEIFIIFHYYIFCSFYRANMLYFGERKPQVAISSTLIYKS